MSFDLKILNGDLVIGPDADLDVVTGEDKLKQDILKILLTQVGSNVFFPWYGSYISSNLIGENLPVSFIENMAQSQIQNSLDNLIRMQKEQMKSGQNVSASELLAAVKYISVNRNDIDPTMFSISVDVVNRAFKTVSSSFDFS
jgi:phage baseplate assembly protein W